MENFVSRLLLLVGSYMDPPPSRPSKDHGKFDRTGSVNQNRLTWGGGGIFKFEQQQVVGVQPLNRNKQNK